VRVLLVRHGIAADRGAFPDDDRSRPLTPEGKRRFRHGARGIAAHVPGLAWIATSPLRRARQTAELLREAHPSHPEIVELEALAPGGGGAPVLRYLAERRELAAVALVGHEPGLSRLEGLMVTGRAQSIAALRKGGAALVEFQTSIRAGGGRLLWHLTAGLARELEP
jgi:phosphohistidine phosphatase